MSKIHTTDIIFATISALGGRVLANLRLSGITSLASIIMSLRSALPAGSLRPGLVTLSIRNTTAGWTHSQSLMLR